jgi:PAS domain S-box-containing protein
MISAEEELWNYKFAINKHSIVAVTDKLGQINYVNDKFCELSQYSREELLGQDHRIINSGHHTKEFFQELYKTIHAGKVWKGEIKNKAKDGSFYWVATTLTPLKDPDDVITQFIAVRTDITQNKKIAQELLICNQELLETKQAFQSTIEELEQKNQELANANELLRKSEEALATSNTRFQLAARAAKIGISDRDIVNNTAFWDDTLYDLFGVKDRDSINIKENPNAWHKLIHPDDLCALISDQEKAIQSESLMNSEFRIIWEDNSIHHLQTNGKVYRDEKGKAVRLVATVMDVTEQKMYEEALGVSEAKYKLLYEANLMPIAIFETESFNILSVNDACIDKYGYSQEELLGMTILDIRPQSEIEKVKKSVNTKDEGVVNAGVFVHQKKNGEIIQVEIIRRDIVFEGKNSKMVVINDVTKRNQAEEKLKRSEEKYKRENQILEESQSIAKLGGWELDLTTGQLYWTAETYRIHDTSPEEFNPTVDAGVGYFLPESKAIISDALEAAMTKGEGYDLYLETCTTKGRKIHVRTTCSVTMQDGNPVKLGGIFQDITEQMKTQNEIEAFNSRLSIATKSANIGIWEFGVMDSSLIWDEQTYAIFGVSSDNFIATYESLKSTMHPEDVQKSVYKIEDAIAHKNTFEMEFRVIWPDKSVHHVGAYANIIRDNSGRAIKLVGANYDLTERKQKEIELIKAKEKAEENDRLKSAFMANMRHEIRNPLNAIMGFSKQLAAPNTSEIQRAEYSSIVINSSHQLLSIIDDITAISLLETKQEHVNKSEVNLNDLLSELEMQFIPQAKSRNLRFVLSKPLPNEKSIIATDKSKLTRIITNFLTNALKFTHEGFVEFGYVIKKEDLVLFVKDTGIGVAPNHLEKIFMSFKQADDGISRKYGGTGLGLSISKGLTEMLGGKIWIESELNKGSTFYVSLPFDQVNYSISQSSAANSTKLKSTILIAEDQQINFLYLKLLLLKKFNCDILHALDGEKAVELYKNNPNISLVLMDINMPIMDGFDAGIIIKGINPELPIIAQTGYDIERHEKYSSTIFNDYVSKPIDENVLLSKIAVYIARIPNE